MKKIELLYLYKVSDRHSFHVILLPLIFLSFSFFTMCMNFIEVPTQEGKQVRRARAWFSDEVVAQLENPNIRAQFQTIPASIIDMVFKLCNLTRIESQRDSDSGLAKFSALTINFNDIPHLLKGMLILSALPKKVINQALRFYVEKAEGCKIYLNNYQFDADATKDKNIKLEIDKWYFLKYGFHLDIPQGTFPSISISDLLEAEKDIEASTVEKMKSTLPDVQHYCNPDDKVLLLNNYCLTLLDSLDTLLAKLEIKQDALVVLDLRGNRLTILLEQKPDFFKSYSSLKLVYLNDKPLQVSNGILSFPVPQQAVEPVKARPDNEDNSRFRYGLDDLLNNAYVLSGARILRETTPIVGNMIIKQVQEEIKLRTPFILASLCAASPIKGFIHPSTVLVAYPLIKQCYQLYNYNKEYK